MTRNRFKFILLFCVGLVSTQMVDAANPDNPAQNNTVPDSQKQKTAYTVIKHPGSHRCGLSTTFSHLLGGGSLHTNIVPCATQ